MFDPGLPPELTQDAVPITHVPRRHLQLLWEEVAVHAVYERAGTGRTRTASSNECPRFGWGGGFVRISIPVSVRLLLTGRVTPFLAEGGQCETIPSACKLRTTR